MRSSLSGVLFMCSLAVLSAQQPGSPAFRFERPIMTSGPGPERLSIDVALVAGGSPFRVATRSTSTTGEVSQVATGGLNDLRLYDGSGREVAYLLVANPPSEPAWRGAAAILPVAPVETEHQKSSGFEVDLGEASLVDRFRIDGLVPPFLKQVRLEGSGDRARWNLLVAEGTLFDLPNMHLRQTELAFTAGSYRYLRLTWDDTRSGRVATPPSAAARQAVSVAAPPPLTATVTFERRSAEPGHSRFRLRLPGGRLPVVALDFDVVGEHVMRDASVYEARLSGSEAVPTIIGRATLKKEQQDSLTASSLRVPITQPTEAELDVLVDDGNNPPLDLKAVTAIFAELPWIYFEAPGGALTARYGNSALTPPRYDLEAARGTLHIESIPDARWGDAMVRTPEENAAAPAPPMPAVGAPVDPGLFQYVRTIPSGDAGLVALRLDAPVLAHSRGVDGAFADVRVIDDGARQIPYLVERSSEPLSIDLTLERLSTPPKALEPGPGSRTVYRVRWPYERLPSPRIVLTTSARVFRRMVRVGVEREPDARRRDPWIATLAGASWMHADQESDAPALTMPLPVDAREVLIIVDEGDNEPLPIATARLLLPSYRLRFFRDSGASLRLAYGRSDLPAPRYDLALLGPQVLGTAANEIAPAAEPRGTAAAGVASALSPWLFWAVLGGATLVLLVIIGRLMQAGTA